MYNKAVVVGRLTKSVELRYTTNGNATCSFTLACDRQMKGADGNKEVDFLNISVPPFRAKLAELCAEYLDRGKIALVDGAMQTRHYDNKDGQKVYVTEIVAESVRFLSPRDAQQNDNNATRSIGKEVDMDNSDIPF